MNSCKRLVAAALLWSSCALAVAADTFPTRPITIIVPIAPGGSTDIITRLVGVHMSKTLGQPVVVDNVSGAGGIIGAAKGARSAPDGYTLVAGSSGSQASSYSVYEKMPFAPEDFRHIGLTAIIPGLVVVNKDLPVGDLKQLVSYSKANPGKVGVGNVGVGTSGYLQCEFLKKTTAADFASVPYRGAGPMMSDLIAGQIQAACDAVPSSSAALKAGQIKAIAVLDSRRVDSLPGVQTSGEQGFAELESPAWIGLSAPRATPEPVLQSLQRALSLALDDPTVKAGIERLGANVPLAEQRGLSFTDEFVRTEIARWNKLANAANVVKQ